MGLTVVLETERGHAVREINDPHNLLHRLLPSDDDRSFQLLRYIDWYGNTVFNTLQMRDFLAEWDTLRERAQNEQELALISDIKELAERCEGGTHLYLKFYGD